MMKKRPEMRSVLTTVMFVLTATVCFMGTVHAEYPERPITIIVGFGPGGTIDLMARSLAMGAGKYLKQSVMIENKGAEEGRLHWELFPQQSLMDTLWRQYRIRPSWIRH